MVHILKSPFIYYYQHQLLQLEGVIYNRNTGEPVSDATTTLEEFASLTDSSLADLAGFGDDITSYSSKNSEVTRYGSLHSTDPRFFFRPSGGNTPAQIRAQRLVTELEIDEKYSPNDPTSVATGRSFW
ncbi:hypothetical protein [uncultured Legionella sp.]|uniref:hypothetical protein n=1 Tax=uncultured Legionella sp. TaxID=210934 RepID=UPI002602A069|nr:hypothetical protein [uncultured Legionella sp.]